MLDFVLAVEIVAHLTRDARLNAFDDCILAGLRNRRYGVKSSSMSFVSVVVMSEGDVPVFVSAVCCG